MKTLRYDFEYCCSTPLFIEGDCYYLQYDELNINKYLLQEIIELDEIYQSTYNQEDPRESGFIDLVQEGIWAYRVILSAELLSFELRGRYIVRYNREGWEYFVKKMYNSFCK